MMAEPTLDELALLLAEGKESSRELVEQSLARIADPQGEGSRTFISVDAEGARREADHQDRLRDRGRQPSPYAGIPYSVKDLFDLAGEVTKAGSKVLQGEPAATSDAEAIARLKAKGFVVLGRTNMTEFAYSGVGLNPHYGTPRNAYDRETGRVPGGSSSGAAISVADGMCALGIGTDTGGSSRIPAAYNGIVGFKPTARRISRAGVFPLADSLDSIGPLAASVQCCATADAIMAGDWDGKVGTGPSRRMRIGIMRNYVLEGLDEDVAGDFVRSVATLKDKGVVVENISFPALNDLPTLQQRGWIVGIEAFHVHRDRLSERGEAYDPRVSGRLKLAGAGLAVDYLDVRKRRHDMVKEFAALIEGYDAVLWPTVPNVAPAISALAKDEDYARLNGLSLRNASIVNFLDGCAASIPMNGRGQAPTGLMVVGAGGSDAQVLNTSHFLSAFLAG
jgi:aspartyl-tRNA(Asn)/glutamyl-tRNA(Gln) amidotransferase subunit A